MIVGGDKFEITLTTVIFGHVLQINTQRISIYVFYTIKESSGEYRLVYLWNETKYPGCKSKM